MYKIIYDYSAKTNTIFLVLCSAYHITVSLTCISVCIPNNRKIKDVNSITVFCICKR